MVEFKAALMNMFMLTVVQIRLHVIIIGHSGFLILPNAYLDIF